MSINYDLALELKEVGFPYSGNELHAYNSDGQELEYDTCCDRWPNGPAEVLIPTLSELITECGDRFAGLTYDKDFKSWHTQAYMPDGSRAESVDISSTPEIAVAKLYIALNKK